MNNIEYFAYHNRVIDNLIDDMELKPKKIKRCGFCDTFHGSEKDCLDDIHSFMYDLHDKNRGDL